MDYETRVKQAELGLEGVYKPQTDFYNKQIKELPGVFNMQRSQADQARVNAFRQIEQTANSRGMFFSGQPIQKQLEYNFGTFDPTMARINSEQQNKKSQLEQALISLGMQKNSQARSWVDSQIKAEQKAAEEAQKRADAERRHQENLRASYARTSASNASKYASQFKVTQKANNAGYSFTGPNGRPVSMAQYVAAVGGDVNTVLDLLQNGSEYDQKIYRSISTANRIASAAGGGGLSQQGIINLIKRGDTGKYYGF